VSISTKIKLSLKGSIQSWTPTSSLLKKKRFFYEGILEELIETSLKKSVSIKKFIDLNNLVEDSLQNLR